MNEIVYNESRLNGTQQSGPIRYTVEMTRPLGITREDMEAVDTEFGGVYSTQARAEEACRDHYKRFHAIRKDEMKGTFEEGDDPDVLVQGILDQEEELVYEIRAVVEDAEIPA